MLNSNVPSEQNSAQFQQSQDIGPAPNDLNQVETTVTSLMNAIELGSSFHGELSTVNATLIELEQGVDEELEETIEAIRSLKDKVNQAEDQAGATIEQVKVQLATLSDQAQTNLTALKSEAEQAQANCNQLGQQVQTFQEAVEEQLETAKRNLGEFQELTSAIKESLTNRKTMLVSEFDAFEQDIREKVQSLTEGFTTLVSESTNQIEAVEQVLDSALGDTIAAVNRKFIDEAVRELTTSAGDLNQAISWLGEAGEASKGLMEGEVGEVLDKVSEVTDLIEKIKPVLDLVKEML